MLFRSLETLTTMFEDRGYAQIEVVEAQEEEAERSQSARRPPIVRGFDPRPAGPGCGPEPADSSSGQMLVEAHFCPDEKVGVKFMRSLLSESPADRLVIVSAEGPTSFTRKEADVRVQFFCYAQLAFVVIRHALVPLHERMGQAQIKELGVSPSSFPRMLASDAVAQYYAYRPGDVIRITRTIGASEPYFYYRRVVAAQ